MKFEHKKAKAEPSRDTACYRKFLAGNKTAYAQAFWENGPRRDVKGVSETAVEKLLPGVRDSRN